MALLVRQYTMVAFCLLGLSCQYPLVLVVSNLTSEPASLSLSLAAPDSPLCSGPRNLNYMPASHVGRRFRDPERRPAHEASFDRVQCAVRGVVPSNTALELEFGSSTLAHFLDESEKAEFTLEGAAGSIAIKGAQFRWHFKESSGVFILQYGRV